MHIYGKERETINITSSFNCFSLYINDFYSLARKMEIPEMIVQKL